MSYFKKGLCIVLAFAMCIMAYPTQTSYAKTDEEIKREIEQKRKKIQESQENKKSIQNSLKSAQQLKKELVGLKADVAAYITKIDEQLADVAAQIEEYEGLISTKETEIEDITVELEDAIVREEEQYESMKTRIKFMYEQGDTFYLELMFNSKSFGDFLTKARYVEQLSEYEKSKLDEYTQSREWTETVKASLEAEKETLFEAKSAKESDEATLEELLSEKENELNNYNSKIYNMNKKIEDYESELEAEVAVIEQLEAQIKQAQSQMGKRSYDGGVFTFPCPNYIRVTDEFGWRTDPITGQSSYHSGIDLGAPAGSPILAAYDGTVVAATYNWSMGNYVMIDHGDDLFTIYMHASALYVSQGQQVVAGEQIAAVGTTGRSTGNHLHFGVRLNGSYVSPWNYLK